MSRADLINTTRAILAKAGFDISSALTTRGICFDVIARRDDLVLVLKILSNVDAVNKEAADELKTLAESLGATPLIIGERSSSGALEAGIVYSRFLVSIMSPESLADLLLDDVPPFIFASPGGLYTRLNASLLHEIREARGISLGTLAEAAGVSRRTIQMYESGMSAMIDAALAIEEFLDVPVIEPIDPFAFKREERLEERRDVPDVTQSYALSQLSNMGFAVHRVVKSPFDAVSKDTSTTLLTSTGPEDQKTIQRAIIASEISKITDKYSVLIVERKRDRDSIESTVVVSTEELQKMDDPSELTDLVAERGTHR